MMMIPPAILEAIQADAKRRAPEEACGVVSVTPYSQLTNSAVWTVYPITNSAPSGRENRYILDPHEQLNVFERMRSCGEKMFAVYHSHPHGNNTPSEMDKAVGWFYPDTYCIIVGKHGAIGIYCPNTWDEVDWIPDAGRNDWFFEALSRSVPDADDTTGE